VYKRQVIVCVLAAGQGFLTRQAFLVIT